MKKAEFFRKGNVIRFVAFGGGSDEIFSSVNAAKRASRKIQHENGGLGCGVRRVVDRFPVAQQENPK
jgi:hypothetical protein